MDLISPSLLENVAKRSKECHERFISMSGPSRAMRVPMDLLEKADTAVLGKWLSLYVAETSSETRRWSISSQVCLYAANWLLRHNMRTVSPRFVPTSWNNLHAMDLLYLSHTALLQCFVSMSIQRWVNSRQCPEFYHQQRAQRSKNSYPTLQTTSRVIPAQPPHACTTDEIFWL